MENYCPHCGEPLKENADFCLSCGKVVKEQPKHRVSRYQPISKTGMTIIGFFAILIFLSLIRFMLNRVNMSYVVFIPAIITLILAGLIAVIAFIENTNKRVSKEVFIIALTIAGYFIIRSGLEIFNYVRFWVYYR